MHPILKYLAGLTCTQGAGAGDPLRILRWQAGFVRGAFAPDVATAALSIARGNGKTTLLSGVACAFLDCPEIRMPRAEIDVVAASFDQARITFEHVQAFLGDRLDDRRTWRVQDSANRASITHRPSGAKIRCLGSDPRKAHGLAPYLALLDEPAQWDHLKVDKMFAAIRTGLGKIPGSRMVALGTQAVSTEHPFSRLLAGQADYVQDHGALMADPPFQVRTWRKANPSLDHMPALRAEIQREAQEARIDPSMLASFKALRLNMGTSDVLESLLLDAGVWQSAESDPPLPRTGPYALGIDLGGSAAMSAACGFWPETRALAALACFPELPSLPERGLADGVGPLYVRMRDRGELIQAGRRVADVGALLDAVLDTWGRPEVIVADRWREAELRDVLERVDFPPARLIVRGQGFRDGGEDCRDFQRAVIGGKVRPDVSLLLRSALAEARVLTDPAGNSKLAKSNEAGRRRRAKDDAVAAAILAVAEGARRWNREQARSGEKSRILAVC